MRHISGFVRILVRAALVVYLLLAAALLGLRYGILPHIDLWRPYIERQLSSALDARITLEQVAAQWKGLNPSLQLRGVDFADDGRRSVLHVPQIRAVLSWRSLLQGSLRFVVLEAEGMDLSVRRDAQGRLQVLGYSFGLGGKNSAMPSADGEGVRWLATQQQIVLRDSTLRWVDQARQAPALVLEHVTLKIHNEAQRHLFSLVAAPPAALGGSLDVRGDFSADESGPGAPAGWDGRLYLSIGQMRPLGWKPWFDLPQNLESGEASARAWLDVRQGEPDHLVADIGVRRGRWAMGADASVQSAASHLFLTGPWAAFESIFPGPPGAAAAAAVNQGAAPAAKAGQMERGPQPDAPLAAPPGQSVEFHFDTQGLRVQAGEVFGHPLFFDRVAADGKLARGADAALAIVLDRADLSNTDMDARIHGGWRQGGAGSAGIADIGGVFTRASIAAIDDYLPNTVNLDAREWMAHGLLSGQITNAAVRLKGDMEYFPFGDDPGQGDFSIQGHYAGGVIDYMPPRGQKLGWPRLEDMSGTVSLDRVDLRLNADRATMRPAKGEEISLHDLKARIPDLEHHSVLHIDGQTRAAAAAYLSLMHSTPLGGMLGGDFDQARAEGDWEVPIAFDIPLHDSENTTVQGQIRFGGGSLSLMPEMPVFQHVSGALDFSEAGMRARDLSAQFLGGPLAVSGGLGTGQPGLQLRGHATAAALTQYVGLEGMKRLSGKFAYGAQIQWSRHVPMKITVESTLAGLALDLPAPLHKTAEASLPLHMSWAHAAAGKDMLLSATLGPKLSVSLAHAPGRTLPAYFRAGAIGLGRNVPLPSSGLVVDAATPQIDASLWNEVVDEFSQPLPHMSPRKGPPVLPDLQELNLRADTLSVRGLELHQATFTASRPAPMQWRAELRSAQTSGTIFWREAQGKVAGQVDARFDRLALGGTQGDDAAQTDEAAPQLDDQLDIPAVNLQANHFSLYGHELGKLSLVGVNESRGQLWRLDKLSLDGASTRLQGTGRWRLQGPDRGLTLDAAMNTTDMGAYLDQMGFKNTMSGGQGSIKGRLEWRNLPWKYQKADLNGRLDFSLQKGRFSNLNSKSARLLELLSLQSVRRLATLNFSFGSLLKDGFPYDNLRGTVSIKQGVMSTDNYRVTGPAGTIVIGGTADMNTEKLDLQAVVVPNLDVSGAAIAAGIALNPIIGIGAFLTQWLLRAPLARAMTAQYHVTGDWDDPKIDEAPQAVVPPASPQESAGK